MVIRGIRIRGYSGQTASIAALSPEATDSVVVSGGAPAEWRRAYELGGRVSQVRRIFTLFAAFDFFLLLPCVAIVGEERTPALIEGIALGGVSAFIVATLLEALREIRFRRKDQELHRRFSIWQTNDLSPSFLLYRRDVLRHWLTGKDPEWYVKLPR